MPEAEERNPSYPADGSPGFGESFRNPPLHRDRVTMNADLHAVKKDPTPTRASILHEALSIVTKDRNQAYGNPEDNFRDIGWAWEWYLNMIQPDDATAISLESHHVADLMILMKIARNAHKPGRDNYVDIAGYASCGAEVAHV